MADLAEAVVKQILRRKPGIEADLVRFVRQ
jgi:hypothetical protein